MKIRLEKLVVRTKKTTEHIEFSDIVTFIHGPIGKGKSSVARLIDYCFGGELERTPAIQQEFVAAELLVALGNYDCTIERAATDTQYVRLSWSGPNNDIGSVNAPLPAQSEPLIGDEVFNLSDLIFFLCGVSPIKVRRSSRDADSPLIRLSFRDVWWYCYLDQTHLDSSFFRLEDAFRSRKSQDAMRFFTGLHSERLSQLEAELLRVGDEQRGKREAVRQIREFMQRFGLGSELDLTTELENVERQLAQAEEERRRLEQTRATDTHPTDELRITLRRLGAEIADLHEALAESIEHVGEQKALRAEFITAKTRAERADQATRLLDDVEYQRCPDCGADVSQRPVTDEQCRLCGSPPADQAAPDSLELEALRRDLNERIDQIGESIARRENEIKRTTRQLTQTQQQKALLDGQLQQELARYDSVFVENVRSIDREVATLTERVKSLQRLQQMPLAINVLEEEAGALQGRIDNVRSALAEERQRLNAADANIAAISEEFKRIMRAVSFPGVSENDKVVIDPKNWRPTVVHGDVEWSFWDTGSGGKKTLFNVCYALALHFVALERGMPVPTILLIDSPTKNISKDENPDLVKSLYAEIYRLVRDRHEDDLQLVLIDSEIALPEPALPGFLERRMTGEPETPSLIPYYTGP